MLCLYAEYHYAECHVLLIVILSGIMLSVVMLNVVMLNVLMLNVFYGECTTSRRASCPKRFHEKIFYLSCIFL